MGKRDSLYTSIYGAVFIGGCVCQNNYILTISKNQDNSIKYLNRQVYENII
mgnify:CR=1 FL=1|jgi:hypothetical protein